MKGIVIKEFVGLIRGIKSILIVLFITGISILAARSLRNSPYLWTNPRIRRLRLWLDYLLYW